MITATNLRTRTQINTLGLVPCLAFLLIASLASSATAIPVSLSPADLEGWDTDLPPITDHPIGVGGPIAHEAMGVFCFTRTGTVYKDLGFTGDFEFHSKFSVGTGTNADKALGVLFGYIDPDNHYRFTWDGFGSGVATGLGLPDDPGQLGPTYKNVTTLPATTNPQPGVYGIRLIKEVDGVNTVLWHQDTATSWMLDTTYEVWISRTGADINVTLTDETNNMLLADFTVSDDMYLNGTLGLFNDFKIKKLNFWDTGYDPTPTPEPSTLCMAGIGGVLMLGYGWRRRKMAA